MARSYSLDFDLPEQVKRACHEYLEAYLWRCGESCWCVQPILDHIVPETPFPARRQLWQGTFSSDPDSEEYEVLIGELRAVAEERGILLDDQHYGWRYVDDDLESQHRRDIEAAEHAEAAKQQALWNEYWTGVCRVG